MLNVVKHLPVRAGDSSLRSECLLKNPYNPCNPCLKLNSHFNNNYYYEQKNIFKTHRLVFHGTGCIRQPALGLPDGYTGRKESDADTQRPALFLGRLAQPL